LYGFLDIFFGLEEFMKDLGALGRILVVWPSCLAGSTQRFSDFAFLHKILLAGCTDE
jgi:hypothetical protein